jgi:predicted RND superfamily exporter protein
MPEHFAKFVIKYRFLLLILIVMVSLPFLYLTRTTRLSHKAGYIFPWGHPNVDLHIKMSGVFGRSNLVVLTLRTKEDDIFNHDTLGKVYRIQRAIELMDGVVKYNIYSIASRKMKYVKTSTDPDGIMILNVETFDDMVEQILKGDREMLETYRKNILNDDEIYGALVSRDKKGAAILATFKYEEDYLYIFNQLNEIIGKEKDDVTEFHLSGRPIMLAYIHKYMSQILYIFLLALVIMVVLLYIDFGRKRAIFLPLTAGLLSVVWGMGILNLLGFKMDVLSITVPFLVLALSHGHSVQIIQRYYEEARRSLDKKKASEQVIATLMLPASTSIFTDSVGFFSLILLPFPIIQSMAIVAAAGILSIWVTSFILIPIVLSCLPLPSIRELERVGESGGLLKLLRNLGRATSGGRSRAFVLIFALILFLFGIFFTSKLQVGDLKPGSPNFWQDSEYNQSERVLNEHFVGTNLLWIYLAGEEQKDLLKPEVISYFNGLQRHLEELPEINYTLSYIHCLEKVNSALHNNDPRWEILPTNKVAAWECLELSMGNPEEMRDFFELDFRQANIRAFVSDHKGDTIRNLMKGVRSYISKNQTPGLKVEVTAGLIGIYEAILDEISGSQIFNLLFMFTVVFLCSAVAFRSVIAGLLVLIPLILGNIITFAVMALTGVGLFIYTLPVSALGIGVGIDYSLYILARLRKELADKQAKHAYVTTFQTAGRAVCYTAATVTAGVLTLCLSEMRFQALLGVMLGIIMMANMLSAIFVLTSLLSLLKPKFLFR